MIKKERYLDIIVKKTGCKERCKEILSYYEQRIIRQYEEKVANWQRNPDA